VAAKETVKEARSLRRWRPCYLRRGAHSTVHTHRSRSAHQHAGALLLNSGVIVALALSQPRRYRGNLRPKKRLAGVVRGAGFADVERTVVVQLGVPSEVVMGAR